MGRRLETRRVAITSVYAALYAGITVFEYIVVGPLAYGPIQVRVSDALLPLPMLHGVPAVIGLFVGCFIANSIITGNPIDVVFGSLANLISGYLTAKANRGSVLLAATYPVIIVSVIVGSYLPLLFPDFPIFISIPSVFLGEVIAVYVLGVPLLKTLQRILPRISADT